MSADTRRAVHAAAWRGLVARRALVIEPGPPPSFAVTEPHASLLAPLIAPERALDDRPLDADRATAGPCTCARARPWSRRRFRACSTGTRCSRARPPPIACCAPPRSRTVSPAAATRCRPPAAALTAPRDDTSPPLLYAALAVGSVNDRVWVDGGALGLWTGSGTRALTLTPTTPEALRAVLSPR